MKVLAVSDVVSEFLYGEGLRQRFSDVSLVLSCGDLPYPYLEYLLTVLNVPLFYVLGNHDGVYMATSRVALKAPRGGVNVDGRVVEGPGGLLVGGLEGCMCYGGRRHQYSEAQMAGKARRMAPRLWWNRWRRGRALDVLLTHAPPHGIHDGPDPCHRGFRAFVRLVERHHPRFLIHGHTHPSSGYDGTTRRLGDTTVVNVYGYKVLEIAPLESAPHGGVSRE